MDLTSIINRPLVTSLDLKSMPIGPYHAQQELISIQLQDLLNKNPPNNVFTRVKPLGKGSNAVINSASFKVFGQDYQVAIKTPLAGEDDEDDVDEPIRVMADTMFRMNILRLFIPNLPYFYAVYRCPKKRGKLCKTVYYNIVMQQIHGKTIDNYHDINDRKSLLLQVLGVLQVLQATFNLTHNDMHLENLMVQQLENPITLQYPIYTDQGVRILEIDTDKIVYILDLELSSIYHNKIIQKSDQVPLTLFTQETLYDINVSSTGRDMYKLCNMMDLFMEFWGDAGMDMDQKLDRYCVAPHNSKLATYIPSDLINWAFANNLAPSNCSISENPPAVMYKPMVQFINTPGDDLYRRSFETTVYSRLVNMYVNFPTEITGLLCCRWCHTSSSFIPFINNRLADFVDNINSNYEKTKDKPVNLVSTYDKWNALIKDTDAPEHHGDRDMHVWKTLIEFIKVYPQIYYLYCNMFNNKFYYNHDNRRNNMEAFYKLQHLVTVLSESDGYNMKLYTRHRF